MANQRVAKLLSFGFISGCFCLGIAMGAFIRFGQFPASDATTAVTEAEPTPPEPEKTVLDTISIKAVGDIIPGTNFPNYRLPKS
ncbi:CapA family protein, partial [Nodularia spumigena CS-587/03]|nr:CapA family protein [Nodularia spumigena CS-587/03]